MLKNRHGLSAYEIATQSGHQHVAAYLLISSKDGPVFKQNVLSSSTDIYVIGNSGSGKTTLVKALSTDKRFWHKFVKVKGVVSFTAGIVPTTLESEMFGRVNIYDFAGHEEYYASHEIILNKASQPLVLVAVDLSLPKPEIEKQVTYWLSILSNCFSTVNECKTINILIIGSHADLMSAEECRDLSHMISSIGKRFPAEFRSHVDTAGCRSKCTVKFHGFLYLDCRYSASASLNRLCENLQSVCRSIRLFVTQHESGFSNRLCASLMHYFQSRMADQVTVTVSQLCQEIKHVERPGPTLVQLENVDLLIQTCENLSSNGHLLFLPHSQDVKKSLLVLDEKVILTKVHTCLKKIKMKMGNKFGMIEESVLSNILGSDLKGVMEPRLAIKYLMFTQFCTRISAKQLASMPSTTTTKGNAYYFFPNLALAARPSDLFSADREGYTHLYSWCLKCTDPLHFLTPRYLHTLFIQLVKYGMDVTSTEYEIWKNGILLGLNGVDSLIEVTHQTTRVYLVMRCKRGRESSLVQQRSTLITLIKSLLNKLCPSVKTSEFLLLPRCCYHPDVFEIPIPMAKVAHSIASGHQDITYKNEQEKIEHVAVETLLHFDSCLAVKDKVLQTIYIHCHSNEFVPLTMVKKIHNSVLFCSELAGYLEDKTDEFTKSVTFKYLYEVLHRYSIFTNGNFFVSPACVQGCFQNILFLLTGIGRH